MSTEPLPLGCRRRASHPAARGPQTALLGNHSRAGDDCRRGRLDWHDDALAEESGQAAASVERALGGQVNSPSLLDSHFPLTPHIVPDLVFSGK
jgi:hypothetical protein